MINNDLDMYYNNKVKIIEILLSISCIFSIFSQIQLPIIGEITKIFSMIFWSISFIFVILFFGANLKFNILFYLLPIILFDVAIAIFQIFTGKNYLSTQLFYPIHLSVFIFIISYLTGQFINKKAFYTIINSFVLSVLIMAIYIFFTAYFGKNFFSSRRYLYIGKNSFSQNILFSAILVYLYGFFGSKKLKIPVISLLIFLLFILKCRSSIISLPLVIFYFIFFDIKKFSTKLIAISLFILFTISIFVVPSFYSFFVENIIFNNNIENGLDTITSGRISHLYRFVILFKTNPIIGNGKVRIESFPLSVLAGFGIAGGLFLFIYTLSPLFISIKAFINKDKSKLLIVLFLFTVVSLANCFFEEQAPYGPGVKCFFLWIIYGIYLGKNTKKTILYEENSEIE